MRTRSTGQAVVWAVAWLASSSACATGSAPAAPSEPRAPLPAVRGEPTPVTSVDAIAPLKSEPEAVAIVGATLLLGTGERIEDGTLLLRDGKIEAVGPKSGVTVPDGVAVVDARGRFVTPGLIDTHSHMGVYAQPEVAAHADGNEMTDPTTPYVFSEHAFWPQDPSIDDAVEGGITTIQVLPGSGNVIGGRATVLKLKPSLEARAMRFEQARQGLKMACGENPKRVYGGKGQQPMSRMGNIYRLRSAFMRAREYDDAWERYREDHARWQERLTRAQEDDEAAHPGNEPKPPARDLGLETLVGAIQGRIGVHVHCYRADEMLQMLELGKELGFQVASFHHATEAYKIADVLAREGVAASVWADWWGFKLEAYDAVEENAAMLAAAGGRPIIHSDDPIGIQRLNQEAAKALAAGQRMGLELDADDAITWLTRNPAIALGVEALTGTLEAGKMADVVVWDQDPLSIYARTELVFIDGARVFDRSRPRTTGSDFDVGSEVEVLR